MATISFSLDDLVKVAEGATVHGETTQLITGIASLKEACAGDLSFLGNPKYTPAVKDSKASVLFLPSDYKGDPKTDQVYLRMENPSLALARLTHELEKELWPPFTPGIHPSAVVHENAQLDATCFVGPLCVVEEGAVVESGVYLQGNVFIGRFAKIGTQSRLLTNVCVQDFCELGAEVILQPGCVIGSDGFGYETEDGFHHKVPQVGRVVIEDRVEVGANSTIDRARFQETRIGAGTKIDNLVQVAHNVHIGNNCLVVAQVGISGSTVVGENVTIGGQAGVGGHLRIGDRVSIAGQSGVSKNLEAGTVVRGTPALPFVFFQRLVALQKRLPEFFKRLKKLEQISEVTEKT